MVKTLVKNPAEILAALDPVKVDLLHAMLGIASEAGEMLDAVKAHVIYNKPLDVANLREELGDMEFYLEQIRTNPLVDITRFEALKSNMDKLSKRYKDFKYTDQRAIERADKKDGDDGCGAVDGGSIGVGA